MCSCPRSHLSHLLLSLYLSPSLPPPLFHSLSLSLPLSPSLSLSLSLSLLLFLSIHPLPYVLLPYIYIFLKLPLLNPFISYPPYIYFPSPIVPSLTFLYTRYSYVHNSSLSTLLSPRFIIQHYTPYCLSINMYEMS